MTIDAREVAGAHDAMADEYDDIADLWYGFLFNRIHDLMLAKLPGGQGRTALDVGCGTGYQSFLLARAGYSVRGFDVAERLLEMARRKAKLLVTGSAGELLFRSPFPELMKEQTTLLARADGLRPTAPLTPAFALGSATDKASYEPGEYDVVTCCGSVLSFIDDYEQTLRLMRTAMKPGGLLFLEVEQRLNADLLWPAFDRVLGGALHYEQSLAATARNLLARPGSHVRVDYPFALESGKEVVLPLWLFSTRGLESLFGKLCFRIVARRGVHALTNLIPSTILHRPQPRGAVGPFFRALARVERLVSDKWPVSRLGCSVAYCLEAVGLEEA